MANKAFDASKFRKNLTKSIQGLGIGFTDPTDWISTGNYALNYLISGDFNKGVPLGKVTVLAGEPQAGKSYIASGSSYRAKTGEHDDLVSASLLAMRIIQVLKDWDPKVYTSFSQADEDTTERVIPLPVFASYPGR